MTSTESTAEFAYRHLKSLPLSTRDAVLATAHMAPVTLTASRDGTAVTLRLMPAGDGPQLHEGSPISVDVQPLD